MSGLVEVSADAAPLVVGIDPGLNTGIAVYRPEGIPWIAPVSAVSGPVTFTSGQVEGRFAFYETFNKLVSWGVPMVIVMERFTITGATAKKSPQPDPYYIIGAIERQANDLGFPFTFQGPSEAMSFSTDDKLKAAGFYQPGKGHANDAARHVLKYVIHKRQDNGGRDLLEKVVGGLGI
jgi:hypothetical protein